MTKLLIEREIIERVLNVMEMEGCAGLAAEALREALANTRSSIRRISEYSEQAEQKPVCIGWDGKTDEPIMGYAAPVRTKDLTDDEIAEACGWKFGQPMYEWVIGLSRAVIAADREKNK